MPHLPPFTLSPEDVDRVIQMAWEDRTPFEAIELQFGLSEAETIALMRRSLKRSSWVRWRARVQGRLTKHRQKATLNEGPTPTRFRCSRQRGISQNRIT